MVPGIVKRGDDRHVLRVGDVDDQEVAGVARHVAAAGREAGRRRRCSSLTSVPPNSDMSPPSGWPLLLNRALPSVGWVGLLRSIESEVAEAVSRWRCPEVNEPRWSGRNAAVPVLLTSRSARNR